MASSTVCTPSERGVTSRSTRSRTLSSPMPRRTAACTAAPYATASSGLQPERHHGWQPSPPQHLSGSSLQARRIFRTGNARVKVNSLVQTLNVHIGLSIGRENPLRPLASCPQPP
ncbi:chloride channel protein [Striga asiatica]|uniref:Chloride channel protein n=1 Tax=Striga asiatica TaxID=4170 RepID=A0A5A7R3U3_STRAF|nr:chloride channel protein [Striga asiatica]